MKKKFSDAFAGLKDGWLHRSIRIQMILAVLAVIAGLILKLNAQEWQTVLLCIAMVIAAEILNTCIEKLCDLYSEAMNPKIKVIKDLAAGSVLAVSAVALIIAALILYAHTA